MAVVRPEVRTFGIILNQDCCQDVWKADWSNSNASVYKPGGKVEGTIQLVTLQPLNFNGIYLKVHGRMYVGFRKNRYDIEISGTHDEMLEMKEEMDITAQKEYIILPSKQIFGNLQGLTEVLPPGEHQFPFRFDVPTNIPSTIDGRCGFVDYWIEVFINQAPHGICLSSRSEIIIHGFHDLSATPEAFIPFEQSDDRTFCCLCVKGSFGYSLVLPKRGYSPGEIVQPSIVLRNQTSTSAEATFTIFAMVVYSVNDKKKEESAESIVPSFQTSTMVDAHSTYHWKPDLLIWESSPPSRLTECPNISLDYKLQLNYYPKGCNCSYIIETVDLLIGHTQGVIPSEAIPISTQPQTYVHPSADFSAAQVHNEEFQPLLPPPYTTKGGNTVTAGHHPLAQYPALPSAPPVTSQPYPSVDPAVGGERPAPPGYYESIGLTDLSGTPGSSYQTTPAHSYPGGQIVGLTDLSGTPGPSHQAIPERTRPYIVSGEEPQKSQDLS